MINTNRLVKVGLAWMSIVYVICFVGVALFAPIRPAFMMYGLHMDVSAIQFQSVMTFSTFLSGLVLWDIIAVLAIWLFAALYNNIRK